MAERVRRRGVHVYTEMPDRAPGKGKEREREGKRGKGKKGKGEEKEGKGTSGSSPFPPWFRTYSKKCMNAMFPAEETAFLTFPVAGS